jgi:hypothetical protein
VRDYVPLAMNSDLALNSELMDGNSELLSENSDLLTKNSALRAQTYQRNVSKIQPIIRGQFQGYLGMESSSLR